MNQQTNQSNSMYNSNNIKIYLLLDIELQHPDVRMKPNELVVNIQQAREHIKRLKKEAEVLDNSLNAQTGQDQSFNLNQYVNNALYSLAKNDTELNSKVQQYKTNKLPSIYQKSEKIQDAFYLNGYKKYRTKQPTKKSLTKSKVNSFSTRADQSFSLTLQNRRMKIHSFNQKHKPTEINSQTKLGSILQHEAIVIPDNIIFEKHGSSANSSIRNRKYEQKVKLINFNESSFIKDIPSQKNLSKKESALGYDSVLDNFSNHFFMIIKGRMANETPQYASYQRIYKSIFAKIQHQIGELQKLLRQYNVNFARFDGKKLAYLCLKQNIKRTELIDCLLEGREEILSRMPETKYKGKQGKNKAATKIQAFWKMIVTKAKYQLLRQKTIILQGYFRRQRLRLELEHKVTQRNTQMLKNFEQRQLQLQSQYKKIKQQKRIQIHINSIQTDEQKRLTIENFSQRQNSQLSRIFSLKDENVIVIYISPKEISQEVINYYYKILQLSGIKNFKDRLFFMSPRNYKFPEHFSTTKLLYYCSRTLNQLKDITFGMPTILYAGNPCNELIKICDFLGCYLFGGQPNKMKQFMSKSQTKRLLKNLCIETLPGSMEMYDYGEFLNTFSVLIVKNPQVMTWVLKIDDEFDGRGLAYVELGKSKIVTALLKKIQYQTSSQFFTTDLVSEPVNQQITIKIRDYLKEKLSSKLIVATPTLYRTYEEYMGRFIKKGGIIEAHPPCTREYLSYPSISFCMQPDGELKLFSTYQKILSQPFKSVACSFPQKSLSYEHLMSLCRQLAQSFKLRKLFGYFTVDMIFYQKGEQSKYWVTGIEPFLNNYAASFYLFDALMEGKFLHQKGLYLTEVYAEDQKDSDSMTVRTSATDERRSANYTQNSQSGLVSREYIFVPHFLNKNFSRINIKEFFKQARMQQFNFDIAQKHGVCMMLFDELTSGEMGLMAVSENREESIQKLKKVLEFIARITQVKNVSYGKSELEPATDALLITDIISKFLTLQRKEKRKDAKKKAFEQYKNKQNLQLII